MRRTFASFCNIILPGSGLILLRREWLGISHACLFCLSLQVAIWGYWIVPAAVPGWIPLAGLILAGIVWLASQWLASTIKTKIDKMENLIMKSIAEEQWEEARKYLDIVLLLDNNDLKMNQLRAKLVKKAEKHPKKPPR